ncbi:MAG: HAD-IIA family hydrolase [Clostridia bacterium]|nr:HAD-IIA family hydrolase [Clostridia bacterium]
MLSGISQKRLFLLDLDGTLYLDETLFEGTLPFLSRVREIGGRALFLTNNSSRGADAYIEKMARLGIASTEDDFLTSTDATVRYLEENHSGTLFYVAGTESFRSQLQSAGIAVTTDRNDPAIGGVLLGFDTELTFSKLEDVCVLLRRDLPYLATNPDLVCPTWYGSVPDCGSVSKMIENATGKTPRFIGKPEPEMILLALEKTGYGKSDALMIGDRVYTDVAAGVNAGIDTVLVLSGEGTVADAEASDKKPTWILPDISFVTRQLS